MGACNNLRFQLLFAQGDVILQLDTRLRHPQPAASPAAPLLTNKAPDLLKKDSTQFPNLSIPTAKDENLTATVRSTDIPSAHDGTFCPLELVLNFNREGFPQPTFLGQSDSRNIKDRLEAAIPQRLDIRDSSRDMDKQEMIAFGKMMEAAVSSTKYKSNHSQTTEISISTLDTRDLIGVAPGTNGEEWQSRIQSRHLRVKEHGNHANHLYVRGCPANFEFGTSEWVASDDLSSTFQACFALPSLFNGADKKQLRPLVLVGHSLDSDLQYLKLANVHIQGHSGICQFVDRIDVAASFQLLRGETEPRSLGAVIGELGMTGWKLHNAGNDARYTLQALPGEAPHV
ncbi:uncharacterized protein BDW70DRAFT_148976 [Aspergillus foveolatus]|uniref:uncharacterized protein n=1 Tax=Aspergillus foveolatus TaxID=210207 RepID=UPI003CCDE5ED